MSSLMHPVGPEPASVYWRRRIIVIIGILVVLGLLWWLISPGGSSAPASSSASPTPLPTLTSAAPTTSASPSTSVSGAPCADTDITVSVTTDQQTYSVGGPVEFVMKISNTGTVPCVRDVGTLANTFVITSGGFDVWNSDACSSGDESQEEEIPAGEAFAVKGTWDGTVTANGCENATPAEAGAYQVEASNGEVVSEPVTFGLG
jgi:hypothetical protein